MEDSNQKIETCSKQKENKSSNDKKTNQKPEGASQNVPQKAFRGW